MSYITINETKDLSVKVRYNKETYNGQQKGFYLYVTLQEVKRDGGFITRKYAPMDNTNFKKLLELASRYSAKREDKYNSIIDENQTKIKELYVDGEFRGIINLVLRGVQE